ncbi:hypothetical protein ACHMWU_28975 [Aeromicrobium sp. UC242_57]
MLSVDGTTSPAADVAATGALSGTASMLTDYGYPISCSTVAVSGYVKRGATVASGMKIGAINNFSVGSGGTSCTATALNYPLVLQKSTKTASAAEWGIYATATPSKGAASVPIEIRNMAVKMHSTGSPVWSCDVEAVGTLPGTFNQTTQQIRITPSAGVFPLSLTAFDGSGTNTVGSGMSCGGQIYTGDGLQLTGTFTIATPGAGGIHF